MLAAACSSDGSPEEVATESTDSTAFEPKPTITLVVNDWTASAVNVAVAEQLIERHLGYPVVPTRLDDTTEMYEGLADGSLDAVLEIWPSTMSDRDQQYFDRGQVAELGRLGATGKVGWFVPRYVIEDNPALATWEGFADEGVAASFATAVTRPRGRFLGTNPDYRQHDQALIDALGLPFQVEFSGSEAATVAELEAKVDAREPILLYWWTPTAAVAAFDLVNVALPARTEACQTALGDCDYPEDELFKASSLLLPEKAPDVAAFLSAFTLTTDDQLALLEAVEARGQTIDDAAAQWIADHQAQWLTWLPG